MPRSETTPRAVLHFFHFTGCCREGIRSCQAQMRREFQGRLLELVPRLRLVTSYSYPDLVRNLRREPGRVDGVAMSVGCDGRALDEKDMLRLRGEFEGRIVVWGSAAAVAACAGAPAVEYMEKAEGERPHAFLRRPIEALKGAVQERRKEGKAEI